MIRIFTAMASSLVLGGVACGGSLHVPGEFGTIQSAIEAASDGDDVVVAAGTYAESINLLGKSITVRALSGPAVTIIDASGLETSVVHLTNNETRAAVLDGFTITGGSGTRGVDGESRGGGVIVADASPTVTGCRLLGNSADTGGGIAVIGGSPLITGCEMLTNFAGNIGGGIAAVGAEAEVVDCVFTANFGTNGGGLAADGGATRVLQCTFSLNLATSGCGLFTSDAATLVDGCHFEDNSGTQGGGMQHTGGTPVVRFCTLLRNSSILRGAGMACNNADLVVASSRFLGNACDGLGGGLWTFNSSVSLVNVVFSGNEGLLGGAIADEAGGGELLVQQCSLTANSALNGGGVFAAVGIVPTILNSIIWGNAGGEISGDATVEHCIVLGGFDGANNIDAVPGFVDADGADDEPGTLDDDLRVGRGAPGNDRGRNDLVPLDRADLDGDGDVDELTPTDLDRVARFADDPAAPETGFGTPPLVDLGAYELNPIDPADITGDGVVDVDDLLAVILTWGPCPVPPRPCPADIDGDGNVGVDDLIAVLLAWS